MKRIQIDKEVTRQLPTTVWINGRPYGLIWERHLDGYNFTSYRLGERELREIAGL